MKERLLKFLNERRVQVALMLFFLTVLTTSLAFLVCLSDVQSWWKSGAWNNNHDDADTPDNPDFDDEYMQHFVNEVTNNPCPSRAGLELKDYWACLWRSSITAEGIRQDRNIRWENYMDQLNWEREVMERTYNSTLKRKSARQRSNRKSRRVRRQISNADDFYFRKKQYLIWDTIYNFITRNDDANLVGQYKECQQKILPGVSIQNFLLCVRKITQLGNNTDFGFSFDPTYRASQYPFVNYSKYDEKDIKLPKMKDVRTGNEYAFRVDFTPLNKEENLGNFQGADPYFEDDWSVYRYKYNTLNTQQQQPGWSYNGKNSAKEWHLLNLERFYQPLAKTADFTKDVFVNDLIQTYPAVGEIAEKVGQVKTPLDYRWSKDSGYSLYTRFLFPLIQKEDLHYYNLKGLIPDNVDLHSDDFQLQEIIDALGNYTITSDDYIVNLDDSDFPTNPNFTDSSGKLDESVIPNSEEYVKFLSYYFQIDIPRYKSIKEKIENPPPFALDLETVRRLLRTYVGVVKTQEACMKAMVEEYRLEDENELTNLIQKAKDSAHLGCLVSETFEEAVKPKLNIYGQIDINDYEYRVTEDNLKKLYQFYFDRKESRQRYSLPKYPVEFPVCKNNEPSPIDIRTDRGRKSSLQDYVFGDGAYRLNRFFMFYPLDGSPLLTVGIVNGERLDDSSVQLTGGAVKGQMLTFQYMHIRYSSSWKRVGSEHWIDGKGAPMELQMVFTIAGSADSIKYWHILARVQNQLFQFREKLVIILSVLVDVLESDEAVIRKIEDNNLKQDPYFFEPLAQAAYQFRSMPQLYPKFEQPRGYVSVDPVFRFIDFIPRQAGNFYTYRGSLSWPPCFGYVIWSVYKERLYISKRQFDQFRDIPAFGIEDDNYASDNSRKFDDIYVEEEDDSSLTYNQIENLKRLRTVDRYVLTGYHDVSADGDEQDEEGIVGEEVYYKTEDSNGCLHVPGKIRGIPLSILLLIFLNII